MSVTATQDLSQPGAVRTESDREFESFFLEHYGRIVGMLARVVGDRTGAEDVANEVFWKLYQRRQWLVSEVNVPAWLYRTATRAGIDALRAANRRAKHEQAAARRDGTDREPLQDLLRREQCNRVRAALGAMKPAYAQMLILRAGGSSYKEIAEAMKMRLGNVGSLLSRAEAEFKKRYLQIARREGNHDEMSDGWDAEKLR
jgi:RNA polymerase sigma factor (sigma-70 family)